MKKTLFVLFAVIGFSGTAVCQGSEVAHDYAQGDLVLLTGFETAYFAQKESLVKDENGLISGNILTKFPSGKLEETGSLLKGQRHGAWFKYNEKGLLLTEAHFYNGQKDGIWKIWDENGTLRLQLSYDKGKRVGSWTIFDESGNVTSIENY